MQVNNKNNEFVKALTIGSSLAGKSKTMVILENAKITFKQDRIIISSYDGNSAITKSVSNNSNVTDNVSFCIYPNDFLDVLKTLNQETIEIDVNKVNIQIKHSNGVITLPVANAEEFPTPNIDKDVKTFDIKSEQLFNMIKEAMNFVGRDEMRPVMTGVRLLFKDNTLTASATDAHVLYNNIGESNASDESAECILSSSVIPNIMTMLQETDVVTISVGTKNIIFKTDDCKIVARAIEGRYPNINAVIPASHSTLVKVSKKDFLAALNRTMITASKSTSMVKLNITNSNISMETEDIDFAKSSKDKVSAEVQGDDLIIGLNGKMLKTCINTIESDIITLEMSAPNRAVVIKDADNQNKTVLIMPVSIA